jgi:hypothetical protein
MTPLKGTTLKMSIEGKPTQARISTKMSNCKGGFKADFYSGKKQPK